MFAPFRIETDLSDGVVVLRSEETTFQHFYPRPEQAQPATFECATNCM
jgi:hypothetical protein